MKVKFRDFHNVCGYWLLTLILGTAIDFTRMSELFSENESLLIKSKKNITNLDKLWKAIEASICIEIVL